MANEFVLRKGLVSLGGVRLPFTSVDNVNYSILETDYYIEINASSAIRTVTLPAPTEGQTYIIKNKYDSAYKVTVATNGSETIDGSDTITLSPGESLEVTNNGTNWSAVYETGNSLGAGCYDTEIQYIEETYYAPDANKISVWNQITKC